MSDDLTLGRLLGRLEAFSIVTARCTAAQADAMRQIRDQKLYLNYAKDWDGFCRKYFQTGKDNANRIIRLLDEFGPTYFEVAQLVRISPTTYRLIAPHIRDHALHHNGEAIAFLPENAEKVAAAVEEHRKEAAAPPPETTPPADPLLLLEQEGCDLANRIEKVIPSNQYRRSQLKTLVCGLRDRLNRIEQMV